MTDTTDSADRPAPPYTRLAARLAQRRLAIPMETSLLASRLRCHQTAVQHVEAGRRLPSQDLLVRWAEALGIGSDAPLLLQLLREDAAAAHAAGRRTTARVMRSRVVRSAS